MREAFLIVDLRNFIKILFPQPESAPHPTCIPLRLGDFARADFDLLNGQLQ
jgi:hypothetical protein